MTLDEKFAVGNWVELVPLDPPPAMPGLVLVGQICGASLPEFRILARDVDGARNSGVLDFRIDRAGERCVSLDRRALYDVGRVITPAEWLASIDDEPQGGRDVS
jgi:hypothetical protein